MKVARRISLTEEERTVLNVWLHLPSSARLVLRAKIILLAADGRTNQEIAHQLRASRKTVSLWRRRFLGGGRLAGINREAPRGRQGPMVDKAVIRLIFQKMKERPANVASWTVRSLARELGISPATLHRVWKACDLDSSQK